MLLLLLLLLLTSVVHICVRAGIGFKAVALIAQATYIDSGGFNFVFDTRPESYPHDPELRWLGLVCPRWEEDLSSKMEQWVTQSLAGRPVGAAGTLAHCSYWGGICAPYVSITSIVAQGDCQNALLTASPAVTVCHCLSF
jgi:hypothetical protein